MVVIVVAVACFGVTFFARDQPCASEEKVMVVAAAAAAVVVKVVRGTLTTIFGRGFQKSKLPI